MATSKIIAPLRSIAVEYTDTIQSGRTVSDGVSLSDLTGGIITNQNDIKGLALCNLNADSYTQLMYQNKLMVEAKQTYSGTLRPKFHVVIFY